MEKGPSPTTGTNSECGLNKELPLEPGSFIATQPGLLFIDLWDAMLTPEGKPRTDLWVADGVHPQSRRLSLLQVKIMLPFLGEPDIKPH